MRTKIPFRIAAIFTAAVLLLFSVPVFASAKEADTGSKSPYILPDKAACTLVRGEESTELYEAEMFIDMNGDGEFNASDVRSILRVSADLDTTELPVSGFDANGDGEITAEDARLALRASADLDTVYMTADLERPAEGLGVFKDYGVVYLLPSGTLAEGLKEADGRIYYFGKDGRACVGVFVIDGKTYGFGSDGAGLTGVYGYDGSLYNFKDAVAQTGWSEYGGSWYYSDEDGKLYTDTSFESGDRRYSFDSVGISRNGKEGEPLEYRIALVGDSLVAGMALYEPTDKIDYYGKVGLHTDELFYKSATGSSRYLIDEVTGRGYNKIVLALGVNDIGYATSWYRENYKKALLGLMERAPDADVYAHCLLPVNEARANANGYALTNAQIIARNKVIKSVAEEVGVKYIDEWDLFATENGGLPYSAATDGIHFGYNYCVTWANSIMEDVRN